MPLNTSASLVRCAELTPLTGDMQIPLHGGRSLTILENLWRGLFGFAIELVTFAVDFVPLAVKFSAVAVEFVGFTVEFVALA